MPFHFARGVRLTFAALLFSTACLAAPQPIASLEQSTLPALGKHSSTLTVRAFGRYAVTAQSSQGVALQMVDHMAGAGPVAGVAGKEDGRLDVFLDRGDYRIVSLASDHGKGEVKLAAHPFRELEAKPPRLIEFRLEKASLGDFEQRSYWLEIRKKRWVALEAAGRYLADLRLWKDGTWLVKEKPQIVQSMARPGRPLVVARLCAELDPGLYLLTAYGGPGQPWTQASEEKPFLLRFGIPTLAPAMRRRFTMSEFGVERFLVPSGPTHFRIELPAADAATLQVGDYSPRTPFQDDAPVAAIDKKSLPPVAEMDQSDNEVRLVTVSMAAGKSYLLQHFDASHAYRFNVSGNYWVSTIQTGSPADSVGASAVLTRQPRNYWQREEYVADRTVLLDAPWHRRFNLLDPLTMFVRLSQPSKVRVEGTGVRAHYRFEPFLTDRPADYHEPTWQPSGHEFDLDAGLYVLEVTPETRGILDLHILPDGGNLDRLVSKAKSLYRNTMGVSQLTASARFPSLQLDSYYSYTLYLNNQPGVTSGVVLRSLPIDLKDALPVTQGPRENLTIPVSVPESGKLQALAEDGSLLPISLDNGAKGESIQVSPGTYRVSVAGSGKFLSYSLELEPTRLAGTTPLPPLPDALLAGLPKFPVITPDEPQFLDLDRTSTATFEMKVENPGLYRAQSTGLLHTGASVRTRINPSLFSGTENGVGHNFMIQDYLREGDYQLSVSTRGQTRGHLGIRIDRTDILDGGQLHEGEMARAELPSGHALAYRFHVEKTGNYHLEAMGLNRNFDIRLEDAGGWPVFAPVEKGDLTRELDSGDYRMIVLPLEANARVLTKLDRIVEPRQYQGHGPHTIQLGSVVSNAWVEPATGAQRVPDQWEFSLPAPAKVTIALDNMMEASLSSADSPDDILARIASKQRWQGELPAGKYLLRAVNSRRNNYVDYTLSVSSSQLLAGESRTLLAPATIPLSVGKDGLIELQSFGPSDVRARLTDANGNLVAQNDDRQDDWNFLIARRLAPGQYSLQVDPVGTAQARTTIAMNAPSEVAEKTLTPGKSVEIDDSKVHVYPLSVDPKDNVLLASAKAGDVVGISLEGKSSEGWVNLGTDSGTAPWLALQIDEKRFTAYRLRAWSADQGSIRMSLRVASATLSPISGKKWLDGEIRPERIDSERHDLKLALISLSRAGTFRLEGDSVPWTDSPSHVAEIGANSVITVSGGSLLLVSSAGESLSARRIDLSDSLRVDLAAAERGSVDLKHRGPSIVIATARSAQPGVAMEGEDPVTTGFVPGEAVAVSISGKARPVRVWNASSQTSPIEVDLRQVPVKRRAAKAPDFGISDGDIEGKTALELKLPEGASGIRLSLSPMNAAVFVKNGKIVSTHWAGEDPLQEFVSIAADELWIFNAETAKAYYSIEISPQSGPAEAALKPGEIFERNAGTSGRIEIPVELSAKGEYQLHVRGDTDALWQEKSGRITSGADIEIGESGVLSLQHRPGTIVAWIDGKAGKPTDAAKIVKVNPPERLKLQGKEETLGFDFDKVAMLHLHTRVPVITQFLVEGQPARTEAHLYGADINLPAPAGHCELVLRAIGADRLSGFATVAASGVTLLVEGEGPEILLAPGSARLFSFDLGQPATIGIGVRASSDVVRSTLYDEHGAIQSKGVVQMPSLVPGRYYLAVEMPADSSPVRVRPIVLGLQKPDTRPPFDILQRYVKAKEGSEGMIYEPPPPPAPPSADSQGDGQGAASAEDGSAQSDQSDGADQGDGADGNADQTDDGSAQDGNGQNQDGENQ